MCSLVTSQKIPLGSPSTKGGSGNPGSPWVKRRKKRGSSNRWKNPRLTSNNPRLTSNNPRLISSQDQRQHTRAISGWNKQAMDNHNTRRKLHDCSHDMRRKASDRPVCNNHTYLMQVSFNLEKVDIQCTSFVQKPRSAISETTKWRSSLKSSSDVQFRGDCLRNDLQKLQIKDWQLLCCSRKSLLKLINNPFKVDYKYRTTF